MEPSPLRIRVRGGSIAAENLMMAWPRAGNALTEDCSTEIDSSDGEWDGEEGGVTSSDERFERGDSLSYGCSDACLTLPSYSPSAH